MRDLQNTKRLVIKVGTSTLTYDNGSLNLKRIEELARVIADINNSGKEVILVTSAAISVGTQRLGLLTRPFELTGKQAMSAVGQCQLMSIYDEFFRRYNQIIGQILITKDVVEDQQMHKNTTNTFNTLLQYNVIPVVNANDTISTEETTLDNDNLSAYVANIVKADLLIILTDIDGLYDRNPNLAGAKLISEVKEITETIYKNAGGAGTNRGTGGMETKLMAAEIAAQSQTKTIIVSGENPSLIYDVLSGKEIGTYFNL